MLHRRKFEIRIGHRKVRLGERTLIMGVLNVTPDSFSDGGHYFSHDAAVRHGIELAKAGADWIDVGGESTRPGSKPVPVKEELRRVVPVIQSLRRRFPFLPISIDTTKAEVAEAAARAGASIVNDVSGLRFDPGLADVARQHGAPLILMHLRGRPETMQQKPFAKSIWRSLSDGLEWSVKTALAQGVRRSQLIIDPGLGFGKTRQQNYEIIAHLKRLAVFRLPILVGTSRKSFVQAVTAGEGLYDSRKSSTQKYWKLLARGNDQESLADPGTLKLMTLGDAAAVTASIMAGAHIIRVHDVRATLPAVLIADAIGQAGSRKKRIPGD